MDLIDMLLVCYIFFLFQRKFKRCDSQNIVLFLFDWTFCQTWDGNTEQQHSEMCQRDSVQKILFDQIWLMSLRNSTTVCYLIWGNHAKSKGLYDVHYFGLFKCICIMFSYHTSLLSFSNPVSPCFQFFVIYP